MRKTPEIPHNVFFGEEGAEPAPAHDVLPAKRQTRKQSKLQTVKTANSQKVQATIYLNPEAARELERVRFELLTRHGLRASRSAIVEQAVLRAGAELEALAEGLREE